ncbi:MAG TPA: hypothetical protein VNX88_14295 [Terriglobales bacterium]|jgi:hypothetical protein|nr:hypothetical protein [Terriglobales bacterium]
MKALLRSSLVCLLSSGMLVAQSASTTQSTASTQSKTRKTTTRRAAKPAAAADTTAEQLRELRDMLTTQQQQIRQLQTQLAARDQQVQLAHQAANDANAKAAEASARASEAASTIGDSKTQVATLSDTVSALKANDQNLTETIQSEQKRVNDEFGNPAAIRFKGIGISFTGSFLEAASVWRDKGMGADINTQLTGGPFNGAPNANISELNLSGRQSRLAILAEGKIGNWTGRGYYEGDFLSAGVTSNDNQSNSYTFRQRQAFAQAESASGWTITGGQMWSLATETRSGLANRTEVLPQTIDPQYTSGFTWARQFGFRVTKSFGTKRKFFLGGAVEEAQTLNLGGAGAGTFIYQQAGNTGGLYNNGGNTAQQNYSYNYLPDFIIKAAFEPGFGHYEVFGILRGFRDRVYPNATAANQGTAASGVGAFNYTTIAGGLGFNSRFAIVPKKLDLGFHILGGDGVGRYGDDTLADVTTRADGTLAPIRGGSALAGLELHATPKLEVYGYYGGDYDERQLYNAAGSQGYGRFTAATTGCNVATIAVGGAINTPASSTTNPANCSPDTRDVQELSVGYWYDFYRGPKGRFRQSFQYSYLNKQTWRGTGGSPTANLNMFFTALRYYLP